MRRLEGKVAIVTGATSGIGLATARRLASEGAATVLVARREDALRELAAEIGDATCLAGSVTDPGVAEAAVRAAGGAPDVLVNNAGIDLTSDLLHTPEEDVRRTFETNVFGALWMLQACGRAMVASGGGSIINVTSRLASIGVPTMTIYSASKGALLALTRGAAVELAGSGVRVNAVAPGLTATALVREWVEGQPDPEAFERSHAATIPQGRFALPEEVAATIAFLAADESAHITGASIAVDGGYTAA